MQASAGAWSPGSELRTEVALDDFIGRSGGECLPGVRRIRTAETSYSRSWDDHEGASSRPESNKWKVVREKFEKRYGDNFDVIEGLHNRDLYELTNLL